MDKGLSCTRLRRILARDGDQCGGTKAATRGVVLRVAVTAENY